MISSKVALRAIGILLILVGVGILVGLIACQYQHCANIWSTTYKAREYDSALGYFLEVSKGAIVIAVAFGLVPAIAGYRLLKRAA